MICVLNFFLSIMYKIKSKLLFIIFIGMKKAWLFVKKFQANSVREGGQIRCYKQLIVIHINVRGFYNSRIGWFWNYNLILMTKLIFLFFHLSSSLPILSNFCRGKIGNYEDDQKSKADGNCNQGNSGCIDRFWLALFGQNNIWKGVLSTGFSKSNAHLILR